MQRAFRQLDKDEEALAAMRDRRWMGVRRVRKAGLTITRLQTCTLWQRMRRKRICLGRIFPRSLYASCLLPSGLYRRPWNFPRSCYAHDTSSSRAVPPIRNWEITLPSPCPEDRAIFHFSSEHIIALHIRVQQENSCVPRAWQTACSGLRERWCSRA